MANYRIAKLDELEAVDCPCGAARRAFAAPDNPTATMHLVDISADSQAHYHKRTTEIYLVLAGAGRIELDGETFPLEPMTAVFIKPLCRHRAVGNLRIVNVAIPAFDPTDEFL